MKITYTTITALILGLIIGALGVISFSTLSSPTPEEVIAEYYETENAVLVSPHSLRKHISEGTSDAFVLVDLRSQEEYEKEHIISAINIPAYTDANTSAYGEVDRIVHSFKEVIAANQNEDVIVYCYSHACMTGRKIGKILAEHGIYVKHLGIGWNEWRYDWNMWNHDGETPSAVEDYIHAGAEPGVPKVQDLITPCSEGELGC
jgi:rhodanese-related sulfurtransferase